MPRALPEWIGKTSDTPVPPRVRLRVFDRYEGRCQCGCNRKIRPGEAWDLEDTVALINGGSNRESNKTPWLHEHHKSKTAGDVAEKSVVYHKRANHVGIKTSRQKIASRGFQKTEPQRTASRPIRRKEFQGQP
jgi:5-methylcytosine-specific restriction protein A